MFHASQKRQWQSQKTYSLFSVDQREVIYVRSQFYFTRSLRTTRDALASQLVTDPVALNWRHVSSAFISPAATANWHVNDSVTSIVQYSLNCHLDLRIISYALLVAHLVQRNGEVSFQNSECSLFPIRSCTDLNFQNFSISTLFCFCSGYGSTSNPFRNNIVHRSLQSYHACDIL